MVDVPSKTKDNETGNEDERDPIFVSSWPGDEIDKDDAGKASMRIGVVLTVPLMGGCGDTSGVDKGRRLIIPVFAWLSFEHIPFTKMRKKRLSGYC